MKQVSVVLSEEMELEMNLRVKSVMILTQWIMMGVIRIARLSTILFESQILLLMLMNEGLSISLLS